MCPICGCSKMYTKVTNTKHLEAMAPDGEKKAMDDTFHLVYGIYGGDEQYRCMLKSGVRPSLQVLALTVDPEVLRAVFHNYRESRYPADATKSLSHALDIITRGLFAWFHDDRRMSDLFLVLNGDEKEAVTALMAAVVDIGTENAIDKYVLICEFLRKIILVPNSATLSPHSEIHLYALANMLLQVNNEFMERTTLTLMARGGAPEKPTVPLKLDELVEVAAYS
jgi:hypothetical protein